MSWWSKMFRAGALRPLAQPVRLARQGRRRLGRMVGRRWTDLRETAWRTRTRLQRMTLGTRILTVLVSVAASSTLITLVLQDSSLSTDLQKAAHNRLEQASSTAVQLVEEHLATQFERYRVISSTPQFQANLEAEHAPTLERFADVLIAEHSGSALMFLDGEGREIAGAGSTDLRILVRSFLSANNLEESGGEGRAESRPVATLLAYRGAPFAVTSVPLGQDSSYVGSLVALEPVADELLAAWSTLCRATVSIGPPKSGDPLSLVVRPVGSLQLSVSTSFEVELEALANSRFSLITGGLIGLALASIASVFLSRSLVKPIQAIQTATERIGRGEFHIRLDEERSDEVGDVARAFNMMLDRLEQNTKQRVRVENQISHLAYHDSLTGLGNRRLLKERLTTALEQAKTNDTSVGVIFLDLDRFKNINDTLGHTAGDELLMEVARRLNSCVQGLVTFGDSPEDVVLLARLGGDEFTIMLTDIEDRQQIEGLADQILKVLGDPFQLRGQEVTLTASLGIALSPDDAMDVETLLRDSDMAMFHAKNRGGSSYEFFADSMEEIAAKRMEMENKLQRALQNDEFELFYQPKVDLETNQITGVEALLRWKKGEPQVLGPDEFVPMAEEMGTIVPIGEWVLRTAMEQALAWQRQGLPSVRMAVNVSGRQIEHRIDFAQRVAELLEETGFDPRLLELEITEGALLKDEDAAIALLERLREMGVGLSLDDFGTGYSSLSYLRRLPIDTLKIDRSFVQGADTSPEDAALVGSIIAMAKVLGLRVVVEGVETKQQLRFLKELGCDEIQGFLFSRPVQAEEAARILKLNRKGRFRLPGASSKRLRGVGIGKPWQ